MPTLLKGEALDDPVDAQTIQPYYTGLLARNCGLSADIVLDGDNVVISAL